MKTFMLGLALVFWIALFAIVSAVIPDHEDDTTPPNCVEELAERNLTSMSFEYEGTIYYCIRKEKI